MNRLGDIFLLAAIVVMFLSAHSVEFVVLNGFISNANLDMYDVFGTPASLSDVVCLLMLGGVVGKSAQVGLHL